MAFEIFTRWVAVGVGGGGRGVAEEFVREGGPVGDLVAAVDCGEKGVSGSEDGGWR